MFEIWSGNLSGRFVSTGQDVFLPFPTGVDFITVTNQTQWYADGAGQGVQYYWTKFDAQGRGSLVVKEATVDALVPGQIAVNGGFYLQNTTINTPGASTALTGITANGGGFGSPQVLTGNTQGLPVTAVAGANNPAGIVRIFSTVGAQQLGGMDFTVANVVNNTSFDLIYMDAIVAAPGAGTYRVIPFNPYIYPSNRYITKVSSHPTNVLLAIVTLSVTHVWVPGQKVRFVVPAVTAAEFGMTELNGLAATIVDAGEADVDGATNTITVDIDVSGFTAFAFPLTAGPGFTPAQVIPFGENTGEANTLIVDPYSDTVHNIGQIGLLLRAGIASPAGRIVEVEEDVFVPDVITWIAGKSWNQ